MDLNKGVVSLGGADAEVAQLRGMALDALQAATTANARAVLRGLPACAAD